jgi:flagellar biosynthesis/type III secretory pathway chaperone
MLTNIPSGTLRHLVKLSERKDALLAQVQEIDREIASIQRRATSAGQIEKAPVTFSRTSRAKRSSAKRRPG